MTNMKSINDPAFGRGTVPRQEPWPGAVTSLMRMQTGIFGAALRQNIEMLGFLQARLEHDRKFLTEIAAVDDPAKAFALWSAFWRNAAEAYTVESRKLTSLMTEAATDAVGTVREEAGHLMHEAHATAI